MASLQTFLAALLIVAVAFDPRSVNAKFSKSMSFYWGANNSAIHGEGDDLQLVLNRKSGSGVKSKRAFLFGSFQVLLKLVPGNSAGTVTTYYVSAIISPSIHGSVPSNAKSTRVSSPKSIPNTAVAANVVALVTGTARDIGVSLKMAKKIAEAERLSKKGREYCQNKRRLSQLLTEERSFWWNFGGDEREEEEEEEEEEEDFRDW